MAYQIGTDEAGYGPNLGPLMICGSRWIVPATDLELYDLLSACVSRQPADGKRICICDSKDLYKSSGSIEYLERSVLGVLFAVFGHLPHDLVQLEQLLNCNVNFAPPGLFDSCKSGISLPIAANLQEIETLGSQFLQCCQRHGIGLDQIVCRAIFPEQFNQLLANSANKAELLSTQSISIVAELLAECDADCRLVCDKHGGRKKYLSLINHLLTDEFVTIDCEEQSLSQYNWRSGNTQIELNFQRGGESFLPTAWCSMVAKYVRELTMLVWNKFWSIKVPGIKPTKGYPVDARRFRREIVAAQQALNIDDDLIWRMR